jgi:hypothetical protein
MIGAEEVYVEGQAFMERETGIEPATSSLGSWRSTAELLPLASKEGYHR